jgi:hypothetical protein
MIGWDDDSRKILNWFAGLHKGHDRPFFTKKENICVYVFVILCIPPYWRTKDSIVIIVVRKIPLPNYLFLLFFSKYCYNLLLDGYYYEIEEHIALAAAATSSPSPINLKHNKLTESTASNWETVLFFSFFLSHSLHYVRRNWNSRLFVINTHEILKLV